MAEQQRRHESRGRHDECCRCCRVFECDVGGQDGRGGPPGGRRGANGGDRAQDGRRRAQGLLLWLGSHLLLLLSIGLLVAGGNAHDGTRCRAACCGCCCACLCW